MEFSADYISDSLLASYPPTSKGVDKLTHIGLHEFLATARLLHCWEYLCSLSLFQFGVRLETSKDGRLRANVYWVVRARHSAERKSNIPELSPFDARIDGLVDSR